MDSRVSRPKIREDACGQATGWHDARGVRAANDIEKCEHCAGPRKDHFLHREPHVFEKILKHWGLWGTAAGEPLPRAPPR